MRQSYCYEHGMTSRDALTLTPACGDRVREHSIAADDVINLTRPMGMSDREFKAYLTLMEDVDRAVHRGCGHR